jgi:hypothetical protein
VCIKGVQKIKKPNKHKNIFLILTDGDFDYETQIEELSKDFRRKDYIIQVAGEL